MLVSLDSIYDCVISIESMECCCQSVDGITRITPQTLAIQYQNLEKTKKLIASESGSVRFAEKPCLKVLFANLLGEKNTVRSPK